MTPSLPDNTSYLLIPWLVNLNKIGHGKNVLITQNFETNHKFNIKDTKQNVLNVSSMKY